MCVHACTCLNDFHRDWANGRLFLVPKAHLEPFRYLFPSYDKYNFRTWISPKFLRVLGCNVISACHMDN